MDNTLDFFTKKKPWSKYKDLILDYYLTPYLAKVATLPQPIVVVDCFAGPGKFDDGQLGSPLIISQHLSKFYERHVDVLGFYIEKNPLLYERLQENTRNSTVPVRVRLGSFRDYLNEISNLASTHTVFVYLDPIKPSDLLFDDMQSVYDQLKTGQSVETLINFMSTGFLRAVWGSKLPTATHAKLRTKDSRIARFNQIAGGTYWQEIALNKSLSSRDRVDQIAEAYANQLHTWFKWVLAYPIREKYEHKWPKYHLVFGSRSHHAVDLMNRAMVKARREFVGSRFKKGMLFDTQPIEEDVDPQEIRKIIIETSQKVGKQKWALLRAHATVAHPNMYTDSEFNSAIKQAIKDGDLGSESPAKKVDHNALTWPL